MVMMMTLREKRDIRPVLFKFGVALALSLGGIVYSIIRNKRIKASQSSPSPRSSGKESAASGSDHHTLQKTPNSSSADFIAAEKHEESCPPKLSTNNSITDLSPSGLSNGDKDGFLLPEFNELVKEFDLVAIKANISPRKDVELPISDTESPRGYSRVERDDNHQEVRSLRKLVKTLKERERNLEVQLLEYYGLEEQETAVTELQNRLKLNNMEAKLFALKIESLQADNKRLEAQVADYAKVVADLEAARAKIKQLKKKLRSEAGQNKEQILILQQRVQKLQDEEHKAVAIDPEAKLKLQKYKDLAAEVEDLKKSNYSVQLEKADLAHRLEYAQILATSVLEDEETEKLKQESLSLRKQNEDLAKEIEQLQADRCSDVEELVYLRWINACLRYEMRNYQPGPDKTIARDLSKTLSPRSEEKAKQLILEYANKEGIGEKGINISEFDSDQWSSSQSSHHTDSGDFDFSFVDSSSSHKNHNLRRSKFFGKLMKLLRGKDGHHHHHHLQQQHDQHHSRSSSLERTTSADFVMGNSTSCSDSPLGHSGGSDSGMIDVQSNRLRSSSSQGSLRRSFDHQRYLRVHTHSDLGSSGEYKRIDSIAEGETDSPLENAQKYELAKFAEALKDSRGKSPTFRRRSASYS